MEGSSKRMNTWNVIKISGAWISFCIGSAFATGTGLMQVYGSHGKMAYAIIPIAICMNIYFAVSFFKLGFSGKIKTENAMSMFEYYCGPYLGKAFKWLTIIYMILSPTCMIAGFGASANQYFDIPTWIGSIFMGICCFITVLLGLKKLVDIVGTIGPFIIIMSILVGAYSVLTNWQGLSEGLVLAEHADILKYNDSWFISGLLESAWAPLILGPFLISCCGTINSAKEGITGGIIGLLGQSLATAVMITAYFCQFAEVSQNMLPTLFIVTQISKGLAGMFLLILFLGVYSSAVPSQFNFCANFFPEKTRKYNMTAVCSILVATGLSFVLPFDVLFNYVYVFFSYASWVFIAAMMIRQLRDLAIKHQNAGKNKPAVE